MQATAQADIPPNMSKSASQQDIMVTQQADTAEPPVEEKGDVVSSLKQNQSLTESQRQQSYANLSQDQQDQLLAQNFSKLSLGANDQPISLIIPTKMQAEQRSSKNEPVTLADLGQLNKESEYGDNKSDRQLTVGAASHNNSKQSLRESQKSVKIINKSSPKSITKVRSSKMTNPMRNSTGAASKGSFKVVAMSRRSQHSE